MASGQWQAGCLCADEQEGAARAQSPDTAVAPLRPASQTNRDCVFEKQVQGVAVTNVSDEWVSCQAEA